MSQAIRGTVKWFNRGKGYGFISRNGEGQDLFVHANNVLTTPHTEADHEGRATLVEGQHVTFDVGTDRQGRSQALLVRVVG